MGRRVQGRGALVMHVGMRCHCVMYIVVCKFFNVIKSLLLMRDIHVETCRPQGYVVCTFIDSLECAWNDVSGVCRLQCSHCWTSIPLAKLFSSVRCRCCIGVAQLARVSR